MYSSLNGHKSRHHGGSADFDDNVFVSENDSAPVKPTAESVGEDPAQCEGVDIFDISEIDSQCDKFKGAIAPIYGIIIPKDADCSSCI